MWETLPTPKIARGWQNCRRVGGEGGRTANCLLGGGGERCQNCRVGGGAKIAGGEGVGHTIAGEEGGKIAAWKEGGYKIGVAKFYWAPSYIRKILERGNAVTRGGKKLQL